jgi:hypothetical protein
MAVLDKVGAFLSQIGAEAAPIARQVGTNVLRRGSNVAAAASDVLHSKANALGGFNPNAEQLALDLGLGQSTPSAFSQMGARVAQQGANNLAGISDALYTGSNAVRNMGVGGQQLALDLGLGQNTNSMFNNINANAQAFGANIARSGATTMGSIGNKLANLGLPNSAASMQSGGAALNNLNPQQLAMLGYGAAGLGGVTAGTAAAILENKRKRKAGQYLAAQHGYTMDEDMPILY